LTGPVILTDADGVLLNWEYAFDIFMRDKGYIPDPDLKNSYKLSDSYGITKENARAYVREFNESAAIGFLPPLRDAMHYVQKLHREHGFVFHVISSLSLNPYAGELRKRNLQKLFGETAFVGFTFLDCGADKDEALEDWRGSELWWIEDKIENAVLGWELGLNSILMEHGHNMHFGDKNIPVVKNWKEIYERIT
jgi:hypothetical protein